MRRAFIILITVLVAVSAVAETQNGVTDNTGHIQHFVPLAKQRTKYQIASPILLSKDYITMPCGDYDVVVAK